MIRVALVGAACAVLVGGTGGVAGATVDFSVHFRGYSAVADWTLTDPQNTFVQLSGFDSAVQLLGGKPVRSQPVTVAVSQSFCDLAAGRWVDRYWYGDAEGSVTIDHARFQTASWEPTHMTLSGEEYDTPLIGNDCEALDWEHATSQLLPDTSLTVRATFTATSDLVKDHFTSTEGSEDLLWVTVSVARARYAATGTAIETSDPRLDVLSSLGPADFAFVGYSMRVEVDVSRGPGH